MLLTILPLNPINVLVFLLYKHDAQVVSQTVHLTKNTKQKLCFKKSKNETKAKQIRQQKQQQEKQCTIRLKLNKNRKMSFRTVESCCRLLRANKYIGTL